MKAVIATIATVLSLSAATSFATELERYEDLMDQAATMTVQQDNGFVCAAKGNRPHVFKAFGYLPVRVQRRAQWKCERYTNNCKPLGCKPVGYEQ